MRSGLVFVVVFRFVPALAELVSSVVKLPGSLLGVVLKVLNSLVGIPAGLAGSIAIAVVRVSRARHRAA
ncbi:MAG TPA: hypothetical protein VKV17_11750 [Bryobacteraceae bacterium]|nr:hypothetical protein [Bryobacteraceae bacterium]